MQQEHLDYGRAPDRPKPPPVWDALAAVGMVAPFITVPVFIIGAALLQDGLVNGDGRSWYRAAIRMAIPTGLVTAAGLAGSLRVCIHRQWRRPAAIFGLVVSSLAMLFIVYFTATA